MSGSFSIGEKLAVAGAFCALVAMAVGTEDDPGIIAESPQAIASAQPAPSASGDANTPWWKAQSGNREVKAQTSATPMPAAPADEDLPPGFGATPPPDLPM